MLDCCVLGLGRKGAAVGSMLGLTDGSTGGLTGVATGTNFAAATLRPIIVLATGTDGTAIAPSASAVPTTVGLPATGTVVPGVTFKAVEGPAAEVLAEPDAGAGGTQEPPRAGGRVKTVLLSKQLSTRPRKVSNVSPFLAFLPRDLDPDHCES